ncbi:HAD family hydrolase [Pseudomonas aeruginosa]|nr:HAD family hydrolase [Pseudomonas aeruginosa]
MAAVNEAAITGESAPVIREIRRRPLGGDRQHPGGVRLAAGTDRRQPGRVDPGPDDRPGGRRQAAEDPNEVALDILLIGLTLIFLLVVVTLKPFALFAGGNLPLVFLVALLVTLIPTTIGGLLSAIGIAGMDRLVRLNVIAKSGRAVEAAGDVHVLLLDKTGTITFGNRRCSALYAAPGVSGKELAEGALLASLADDTPEGKSIVEYLRILHPIEEPRRERLTPIAFSAETRLSGVDWNGQVYRKGAVDAALRFIDLPREKMPEVLAGGGQDRPERRHPLLVVANGRLLGAIHLKDVVKPGIRERFAELRRLGIRTVMVTGDNPLTAAAIAAEAGVDDVIAEATRRRNWRGFARSRAKVAWWRCAATVPTTPRRWPRPTSAWP